MSEKTEITLSTLCYAGLMLMTITSFSSNALAAENNVRIQGVLVAEPCNIRLGDDDITLTFANIVDKYLYKNTRTPGQPLQIHLEDCDTKVFKTVTLTLNGDESTALPGMLKISGEVSSPGIAIGFETSHRERIVLNHPGKRYRLSNDNTQLDLNAYVAAEPEAIREKTLQRGEFSAIATFALNYE